MKLTNLVAPSRLCGMAAVPPEEGGGAGSPVRLSDGLTFPSTPTSALSRQRGREATTDCRVYGHDARVAI